MTALRFRTILTASREWAARVSSWFGWLEGLVVSATFLYLGFLRARPFIDDVTPALARGDDWLNYKLYAESILHGGLTIPAVTGAYIAPRGFLYNYFLAAMFYLLGDNSTYIYVVQSGMLGLSVLLTYLAVRHLLSSLVGLVYLPVLAAYMYVDVFRYYAFRLLSENLLIFLLPVYFLLVLRSVRYRSGMLAALAGVALGLCVLARPNTIPVAGAAMLVYAFHSKRDALPWSLLSAFFLTFVLTFSTLIWRDYVVTGHLGIVTLNTPSGVPLPGPFELVPRALFCLGFTRAMGDQYMQPIRPHWVVMWALFGAYVYFFVRKRQIWTFDEALLFSFVPCYLLPLIAVGPIDNYGFRMIVPVIPIALFFSFRAGDEWSSYHSGTCS